jgi:hypothetical protein
VPDRKRCAKKFKLIKFWAVGKIGDFNLFLPTQLVLPKPYKMIVLEQLKLLVNLARMDGELAIIERNYISQYW